MYLLPYRLEKISEEPPCWKLQVFLSKGGTDLWCVDSEDQNASPDSLVTEYLLENGITGCVKGVVDQILYYEVDPSLSLDSFYTFQEFLSKEQSPSQEFEIWRPFFWIGTIPGEQDEYEWLKATEDIHIGPYTINTLWKVLRDIAKKN